jgi:hypothetical protein
MRRRSPCWWWLWGVVCLLTNGSSRLDASPPGVLAPAVEAWRQLTEDLTRIQGRARLVESVWKDGQESERIERVVEFAAWGNWLRVEVEGQKTGGRVAAAVNAQYGFVLSAEPGRGYAITSLTRVPASSGAAPRRPAEYESLLDDILRAFLLAPSHLEARPLHEVVVSPGFRLLAEPQPLPDNPGVLRIHFEYEQPGSEQLPPDERPLPFTDSWLEVEPQHQWRLKASDCGVAWGRIRREIEYFSDLPHRPRQVVQRLLNSRTGRERRTEFVVETLTSLPAADEAPFTLSGFGLPESAARRVLTDAPAPRSRPSVSWALLINGLVLAVIVAAYFWKRPRANRESP